MPVRRVLACTSLALVLPASLLAGPGRAAATDSAEQPTNVSMITSRQQRVRLEALPPIVQFGGAVADPDAARAAFNATVRPVRPGRRLQLQVLEGQTWIAVDTARQDGRGRAEFAAAASVEGRALTYRVRAQATPGLRAVTSGTVSTERWLDASWTDEFSGADLGPAWTHRGLDHVPSSRRTCSRSHPSAVRVGGGAVRLSVLLDPTATTRCRIRGRDAVAGRYAYRLNGHIGTESAYSFRYGVAAARVKFQRLRGQHGAFWLQPAGGINPDGSEIDVAEYFGDDHPQGGLATFVHRYDGRRTVTRGGWIRNSSSFLRSRRDGWSRNYHVFSVEWTPRSVVYRIDGKESARMRGDVSSVRQFLILSLIAADYEIPRIRTRQLPQHMYVDWVRVWETPTP